MILGLIFSDFNEVSIIFQDLDYLLAFFVKLSGFFALCLFLGIWVKRSAFALGFLILISIAEGILFLTIRFKSDTDFASKVMQFFPLTSMSNLVKEPFTRLSGIKSLANQVGESFNKDYSIHFYQLLIVAIWAFVFIYLSYRLLKKRDL